MTKDNRRNISADSLKALTGEHAKHKAKKVSEKTHKSYLFSLTESLSEEIDDYTLIAKKTSRSDVVKAGLYMFSKLSKSEQQEVLKEMKGE